MRYELWVMSYDYVLGCSCAVSDVGYWMLIPSLYLFTLRLTIYGLLAI